MKRILFISSNSIWGGSEVLWSETALKMLTQGYEVHFAVSYKNSVVDNLKRSGAVYYDLNPKDSLLNRVWGRALKVLFKHRDSKLKTLLKIKPSLVIISQGNNVDGLSFMQAARKNGFDYVTVTQLVTEMLWTYMSDDQIDALRLHYKASKLNYFVSHDNLSLHKKMLGDDCINNRVIRNPINLPKDIDVKYPPLCKGKFQIALVGRLETFHKGQDILLEVIKQKKWQDREVNFTFYGDGPHKRLLQRLISHYFIKNVEFGGHIKNVSKIWDKSHLLILPSRMEGQSLALIEAMWFNRAAIVTNVGGAHQLINENCGFLVDFPNHKCLDAAMECAWSKKDSWETMGANAGKRIRQSHSNSSIDAFCEELKNMID